MSSTVVVHMRTCGRTARITVAKQPDGTVRVAIDSDCANVASYARLLGDTIAEADVLDRAASRITAPATVRPLTAPCLVPNGVLYAASLELGLLSKRYVSSSAPRTASNSSGTDGPPQCGWSAGWLDYLLIRFNAYVWACMGRC